MELLVATWTLRLSLVGALAVGAISLSAAAPVIEAVDRAVITAFALTFLGRQLIGWLETPQQRMLRLRARRQATPKREQPARKQKRPKDSPPDPQAALAPESPASSTP
jgi:hypothetical protein